MKNIDNFFATALNIELEKMPRGGQSRLSEATNIHHQSIISTKKGRRSIPEEAKRKVAKYFGYEYEEFLLMGKAALEGKKYEPPKEFLSADEMQERGFISVPFSNNMKLAAGGGGEIVTTYNENESNIIVHGPSINRYNSKGLHAFRVGGDSMEPLIAENSIVLVDIENNDLGKFKDGQIYVICRDLYDGECAVKILRWADKYKLLAIESANKNYGMEFKKHGDIKLVGKVIWAWRDFDNYYAP